jgi:ribokinase
MPKVVVIGSANVDLTIRVDRLPQLGETVSGGEFYTSFGGKGANQAVAAYKAGAEVRFLAKVGCDQNGEAIIKNLEALGLSSEGILRDESRYSGVAFIMVDRMGSNTIAVAPGSNRNLTEEDIHRAESDISWGEVLLIQLEVPIPTVREALRLAKAHGLLTILNPAPARRLPEEIVALVDILTPNEIEAGKLTGEMVEDLNEATQAASKLLESGVGHVIITLGEKGTCWVQRDRVQAFRAFPVAAVDCTAAGDAFNGALALALAEERALHESISFANAAGALSVTRKGAQDSLPTREEITYLLMQSQG